MQTFDVSLGQKDLYTLKNLSFDIVNSGSADLQIDSITPSSNIILPYIKVPFTIIQSSSFNMYGDIKILNAFDSTHNDFIDLDVSWVDEESQTQTDTYRYYLNYEGILADKYTQILEAKNITYIKNMLYLLFDTDGTATVIPDIILRSIDDVDFNVFSTIYRLADDKFAYVFIDNNIANSIIDDNVTFLLLSNNDQIEIKSISLRTM